MKRAGLALAGALALVLTAPAGALADVDEGLKALQARDFVAAGTAFNEAAKAGDPDGNFYLGRMVERGLGTAASLPTAVRLYKSAAEGGSALAQNRLGLLYLEGAPGLVQDYAYARELICKAAEGGLSDAQFNCGVLFADGRGGDKNMEQAAHWYRLASAQEHIGGTNLYGLALLNGNGVETNPVQARAYFVKSAAKLNPLGLFMLGRIHAEGTGLAEPDPITAHLYYNLASANGHPNAAAARAQIEQTLQPDQVAAAQARARTWTPTELGRLD